MEIQEATIAQLRARMAAGELSAVELTRFYLDRIAALNENGPELRAVIETNPDAEAIAAALDAGPARGPLHGIPVLVKDNIDTADRMHTSGGSFALLGSRPARDADVVARLRAAGAIVLGKTNLTTWITGSSGWSPRGGQCRNPYRLDRSPLGSSAGSAVGVAANLCAAALGVETVGSILGPASANCVVGLKPTVGLTSRDGLIPGVHSMDSIGPLTRTVADAALMLGVLTGRDYSVGADGLCGARIGVPRDGYFGFSDHADAVAESALKVLASAGAVIVDDVRLPTPDELMEHGAALATVQFREAKHWKNAYLTGTPGDHPRSLDELIAYNREHADVELRWFGQESLEMVNGFSADVSDVDYRDAVALLRRLVRDEGIDAALGGSELDALVMPTMAPPWKIDLINGDPPVTGSALVPGLAGYPAVNVPAGFVHGLPVGITFAGGAGSESTLIRLAHGFEQASVVRRAPEFLAPEVI
ncbi:amidase family protein [Kutzneria sp. NPDC052558]|uniref:amidase family protein n=1 Tax=Kutzneria sp. NPDC052558 TaxID=3364121 RepID=UPI0037C5B765